MAKWACRLLLTDNKPYGCIYLTFWGDSIKLHQGAFINRIRSAVFSVVVNAHSSRLVAVLILFDGIYNQHCGSNDKGQCTI